MRIVPPDDCRDERWLAMRLRLWPEDNAAEHLRWMADASSRGYRAWLAIGADAAALGFAEAALRRDYVNGTNSSPVAFLEGLYVEPAHRRQGVARALVAAVERWAAAEHCSELASDSPFENADAHAAHRALGFEETERVVYFRRAVRAGN